MEHLDYMFLYPQTDSNRCLGFKMISSWVKGIYWYLQGWRWHSLLRWIIRNATIVDNSICYIQYIDGGMCC